ncbi:MAG: phosphoribosylglycinamide formyltransferase [Deltaproteobacteria bacterium]|nr:phosphoribosylglycinamide formyltransferase [Deltaproteobacteria bacterium]MBI4223774.1 phosphoribosylglycinamide formyltransferase [Deltaproteobacteria bacterium]
MKKLSLGVLVSGNGTNLQAIIDACEQNQMDATVAVVISNNPEARALQRAKKRNIPHAAVANGPDGERNVLALLKKHRVELVCLAGFMKILSPAFLKEFPNRVINIHPALLPAFPGLNAVAQALRHGVKISGATVHFVDVGCDTGPIILQSAVPVYDDDTEASLHERILKEEHKIYPQAIRLIATESLKIEGRRVIRED